MKPAAQSDHEAPASIRAVAVRAKAPRQIASSAIVAALLLDEREFGRKLWRTASLESTTIAGVSHSRPHTEATSRGHVFD